MKKIEIAKRLDVHRSTIHRELKRNTGPMGYVYQEAQQRTDTRRWCRRCARKMDQPEVRQDVCRKLKRYWSPDQIAGRSHLRRGLAQLAPLSRQTIYNWINQPGRDRATWRACLRFGRPRRRRPENRGRLPNAVSIEGRPQVVDRRMRYGDWEGDTIVGRGHRGGLVSLVERKSGFTLLARVGNRQATTVREAAENRLAVLPSSLRRTMTFDNGKEFAEHEALAAALGMQVYFARPYRAWERGTNENTNGLVRQYAPKGTNLKALSHRAVAAIESSLNDRPRKRLGYLTPREVLRKHTARRSVAFEL
jgi:transposase, IS30 family